MYNPFPRHIPSIGFTSPSNNHRTPSDDDDPPTIIVTHPSVHLSKRSSEIISDQDPDKEKNFYPLTIKQHLGIEYTWQVEQQ